MTTSRTTGAAQSLLRLEGSLKLRYLGIGFIWAWVYGSYETFAVYPERTGIGINADSSWLVSATVVTLTLFVLGFMLGRRSTMAPRWLGIAASAAAGAGTLLSGLAPDGSAFSLVVASGILTGFGTGALYVLWGQALAALDIESAELAIPAASLIMLGCALVLPYLPSAIGVVATASLPVASGLMLLATYRDIRRTEDEGAALESSTEARGRAPSAASVDSSPSRADAPSRPALGSLLRIAALLFLSYFVMGCSGTLQVNVDAPFGVWGIDFATVIGSFCGIALVVGIVLFAARPSFDGLFRFVAPLLAIALALLPWADLWAVALSTTLIAIADTTLTIATVLFVVTAAKRGGANAALGIGIAEGSLQLGVLAGNLTGLALGEKMADDPWGLFTIALGLLAVFSLSWLGYPTNRFARQSPRTPVLEQGSDVRLAPNSHHASAFPSAATSSSAPKRLASEKAPAIEGAGSIRSHDSQTSSAPTASAPATASLALGAFETDTTIDGICQRLTEEHGLSGREAEILGYLARGRSQPYIREELVLSKNTVATHVKHIYQKLDVHSRQELLDLFE